MRHERLPNDNSPPARRIAVLTLAEAKHSGRWDDALAGQRKDHRYHEIVEHALRQGFEHRYFAIHTDDGRVGALVPFFLLDLDMLAGTRGPLRRAAELLRRPWPHFMQVRALMVGCPAGDGHLDDPDLVSHADQADQMAAVLLESARNLGASLIVLKEFPAKYRESLAPMRRAGFMRIPSFPSAGLDIDYPSFDAYMARALSASTRRKLRLKFRKAQAAAPIELTVTSDITPVVDEIYPLYLNVFERAKFRFEKLTPDFLCALGQRMPDRVRFFVWRQEGRAIAFGICMAQGMALFGEYLGFDYGVALDIHLYHYAMRDLLSWAMANGYKSFHSNGPNYDPKLHLRFRLEPIDLYVRHVSSVANAALSPLLPWLEPTHSDPILKRFPNYSDLW